jgi:hypothetical protein
MFNYNTLNLFIGKKTPLGILLIYMRLPNYIFNGEYGFQNKTASATDSQNPTPIFHRLSGLLWDKKNWSYLNVKTVKSLPIDVCCFIPTWTLDWNVGTIHEAHGVWHPKLFKYLFFDIMYFISAMTISNIIIDITGDRHGNVNMPCTFHSTIGDAGLYMSLSNIFYSFHM